MGFQEATPFVGTKKNEFRESAPETKKGSERTKESFERHPNYSTEGFNLNESYKGGSWDQVRIVFEGRKARDVSIWFSASSRRETTFEKRVGRKRKINRIRIQRRSMEG